MTSILLICSNRTNVQVVIRVAFLVLMLAVELIIDLVLDPLVSNAELDHPPMAMMSWSENPSLPSIVIIPILKWEDILPIVV